ncbi:hypothetical protein HPB50_017057 [Hyalomma asiaticum]|uniref:Uncharacterized protein n=1 Tax=Hyalomma asiaticum TaxID=266040 RepID=A0ACB7TJL0_HYAAI|nr:hypothetical protein HPB50_017057 [Hyalomma asiaticum]
MPRKAVTKAMLDIAGGSSRDPRVTSSSMGDKGALPQCSARQASRTKQGALLEAVTASRGTGRPQNQRMSCLVRMLALPEFERTSSAEQCLRSSTGSTSWATSFSATRAARCRISSRRMADSESDRDNSQQLPLEATRRVSFSAIAFAVGAGSWVPPVGWNSVASVPDVSSASPSPVCSGSTATCCLMGGAVPSVALASTEEDMLRSLPK